ncbi:uncharacterized protein LOC132192295 [Corylus avellana]|uniref:uncharacterized protein LOC132192295 n=1 Tax=Corylus avellana TaxID=13451 RepID=UPI001E21DFA8|nr:uncharacterized protein LOC132192295 [Corylus avellana]
MRIRKRQVPFPLSSLSPVPLSDPLLNRSPVVQLQLHDPNPAHPLANLTPSSHSHAYFDNQPSDHSNQTIGGGRGFDCSDDAGGPHNEEKKLRKDCLVLLQGEDERGGEGEKSNDSRKGSIQGAETITWVLPESTATHTHTHTHNHQASVRWCDGEKAFPPKKRRSTFERRTNEDELMEKDKKMKTKMKTKMNKKCAQQNDNQEEKEAKEGVEISTTKKRARGGALMEGSRCSRVNGRGWRCCQQTLVGYSLCEHHLGKGRLRSMTSVRSRSLAGTAPKMDDHEPFDPDHDHDHDQPPPTPSSSLLQENKPKDHDHSVLDNNDHGEDEDEKKPLMVTKKRMKLGMVKARSISSLLGQTNNGNTFG